MTAPFATPPSRSMVAFALGGVLVAAVMPFVRREDVLGWIALAVLTSAAIGIWALLLWGAGRGLLRWWRNRRDAKP